MAALPVHSPALNADQSAALLAAKIRSQEPFFFIRYGDGALECMAGSRSQTRDGERYHAALGALLRQAWDSVIQSSAAIVGDWQSASFDAISEYSRYEEQYEALIGDARPLRIHFEALLLMRESADLVDFYRAVKEDTRRKIFMGPAGNQGAAQMLGADFLETPMGGLFAHCDRLYEELVDRDPDVVLYGSGMAGTIPVARWWNLSREGTAVNLGSAMDPLFRGVSRRQQLSTAQARHLFREFLPCFGTCCTNRKPLPARMYGRRAR